MPTTRPWWLLPSGRIQPLWWVALGAAMLWIDYLTSESTNFPVVYVVPVILAAWYSGMWPAVGLAIAVPVFRLMFLVMPNQLARTEWRVSAGNGVSRRGDHLPRALVRAARRIRALAGAARESARGAAPDLRVLQEHPQRRAANGNGWKATSHGDRKRSSHTASARRAATKHYPGDRLESPL